MNKLIVKRKGADWDLTAEEIYTAYHDSGKKLSIEFESIRDMVVAEIASDDRRQAYLAGHVLGEIQNNELLDKQQALNGSIEDLSNYMKRLKVEDDYPARVLYLSSKQKKLTADELSEMQKEVSYWRDETLESYAENALIATGQEVSEDAIKEVIALLIESGHEEISEGLNKGLYQYKKKDTGILASVKQKLFKK